MRQNRCIEAKNAYGKVDLNSANSMVHQKYEEYQRDLLRTCACKVQVICNEPNSQVFVDNISADGLCGDNAYLTPGIHHFREDSSFGSVTSLIELKSDGILSTIDFITALKVQQEQQAAEEEALRAAEAERAASEEALRTAEAERAASEEALRVAEAERVAGEEALRVAKAERDVAKSHIDSLENEVSSLSSVMYSRMRIAGYSLIGTGVAIALAGGIWMGMDYRHSESLYEEYQNAVLSYEIEYKKNKENPGNKTPDYPDYNAYLNELNSITGRSTALTAVIAVGSAVAVTGVILTTLGHVLDHSGQGDSSPAASVSETTAVRFQPVFSISPSFSGGGFVVSF